MSILLTSLVLLLSNSAYAQERAMNEKAHFECAEASSKLKAHLPEGNTTVWCADWKDLGPMQRDYTYAMVVAAFREKRLDRRQAAMKKLETYECEDVKACRDYETVLDWAVKSSGPNDRSALKKRGEELRAAVRERLARIAE